MDHLIAHPPDADPEPTPEEQRAAGTASQAAAEEEWAMSQAGPVEGRMGYYGGPSPWEMFLPEPNWEPPRVEHPPIPPSSSGTSGTNVQPPPPHFRHGIDQCCAVCERDFIPDQFVSRMSCGHMFHHQCCEKLLHTSLPSSHYRTSSCPTCDGHCTLISTWTFIDPGLFTQFVGEGRQAPNLLATTPTYTHQNAIPKPMPDTFQAGGPAPPPGRQEHQVGGSAPPNSASSSCSDSRVGSVRVPGA